jgi:STE24 endopeptidase
MPVELPKSWRDHDQSIRPYLWSQRAVGWSKTLVGLFFVAALLVDSRGRELQVWLRQSVSGSYLVWLCYFGLLGAVWEVISLPFGFLHHWVERRFQLSKQSYGAWFVDRLKGWGVGIVLAVVVLSFIFASVHFWRPYWWIVCSVFLLLFSILLAQLAPVLLIPIFFKLKPMEDTPLKQRLLALCSKFGIDVKEVFHLGMSDKTEKGNAAFTGLGRTKRILIGDTLYEKFPPEQVEAVFAHELGHQVHNDLWKGIGLSVLTTFAGFYVAQALMGRYVEGWFDVAVETPFGMFLFFITLSVVQMPLGWLTLAFSRQREREADRFAAQTIGVAPALADSLERLTFQNRGQFRPSPIREFFGFSHPAPWRRILRLRAAV